MCDVEVARKICEKIIHATSLLREFEGSLRDVVESSSHEGCQVNLCFSAVLEINGHATKRIILMKKSDRDEIFNIAKKKSEEYVDELRKELSSIWTKK